ncbi:MAG: hypothetical protein NTY45_15570 [Elusimicrobia bacterium]|nr:hypothetical protein [Elusimicrobiota bacterium]
MTEKISLIAGLLLMAAGYFRLHGPHYSENALGVALTLMGAGLLLVLFPAYRFALAASKLKELLRGESKIENELTEIRLRFICIAAGVAGAVGLEFSPGGFNYWTLGFSGFILAAGLVYVAGYARLKGAAGLSNTLRLLLSAAALFGGMVSVITLIQQLSGASDMPTRWNIYSFLGLAGLAASVYAGYYGMAYQTNTDILETLRPFGFTPADSGLLGKDGRYDARGVWEGVETLVNVNQTEAQENCPAGFYLEISCAAAGWDGRRLLVHPAGYFNRPFGAPLTLPRAEAPAGWEKYGVYCDPPEAAPSLLAVIGGPGGPMLGAGTDFSYLLLDKGRLVLGVSCAGHPEPGRLKRTMTLAADCARHLA